MFAGLVVVVLVVVVGEGGNLLWRREVRCEVPCWVFAGSWCSGGRWEPRRERGLSVG